MESMLENQSSNLPRVQFLNQRLRSVKLSVSVKRKCISIYFSYIFTENH